MKAKNPRMYLVLVGSICLSIVLPGIAAGDFQMTFFEEYLYVGGSGPGNYSTIQSAIDAAGDNAHIYVLDDNAPYYEHIVIDKPLVLHGENRNTTIIDGSNTSDIISVYAEEVTIQGFTIQHSGPISMRDAGIEFHADTGIVYDTIIRDNPGYSVGIYANSSSHHRFFNNTIFNIGNEGIYIQNSRNCSIYNNVIHHNGHCAIVLDTTEDTLVEYNNMYGNYATISLWPYTVNNEFRYNLLQNSSFSGMGIWRESNQNYIHHNLIVDVAGRGILLRETSGNRIISNIFQNCGLGIYINQSTGTSVKTNNFIENTEDAEFYESYLTRWRRNYWDTNHRLFFKRITGSIIPFWDPDRLMEWPNFDLFPAQNPYDIETYPSWGLL